MGNVFGIQIGCDSVFSCCLDCTMGKAANIIDLEDNLNALQTDMQKLNEAKNDVLRRVTLAEQEQMKPTDQVKGWLSRVQAAEVEVAELLNLQSREIEKLFLGGYCSKNCKSSYKFGKKVVKKLQTVAILQCEGAFEVVAEKVPEAPADERPTEPTIVGLKSTFDKVWRCLVEEPAGIIGLYGMGGVGKTTLLTQINNNFIYTANNYDVVIWVVVSKDMQLEKIQEKIGKKIGLFNQSWKSRSLEDKALDIFTILSKKKFVLLLDDLWDRLELTKVGVPIPSSQVTAKIVFTTRLLDVCGLMDATWKFKVECLAEDEAWKLFQMKVGEVTLNSHPDIPELARIVTEECDGLPLALITIGRAMSCKKTPEEWSYAIQVLKRSASEFSGMGDKIYPLLKFSYDSLSSEKIRSCFLYCSLFPEDYSIKKTDLIDFWIGEGYLGEGGEKYEGYYIIGVLVNACLLEEEEGKEEYNIKMHDVIRDMALWIACEIEKEKEQFSVHAGAGLTKAPKVEKWEGVRRMSLMENKIENLPEVPTCPDLLTLFLNSNSLEKINEDFFTLMPSLKVLNLSNNRFLKELSSGVSNLCSLKYLDLSWTAIEELPIELKALANLKFLSLDSTNYLHQIPYGLIPNFSELEVLKMNNCGFFIASEGAIKSELFMEELHDLKYLDVFTISLRNLDTLIILLRSVKLQSCTQSLSLEDFTIASLDLASLADLMHLHILEITRWRYLEKLEMMDSLYISQPNTFDSLQTVRIVHCDQLRNLTSLVFVRNLKFLYVNYCDGMEEIVNASELGTSLMYMENQGILANLQFLQLQFLTKLNSIYYRALPFPHLKQIHVLACPRLRKLPLGSNKANGCKLVIEGGEEWFKKLQWDDDATLNAFLPCFKARK